MSITGSIVILTTLFNSGTKQPEPFKTDQYNYFQVIKLLTDPIYILKARQS